MPPKSHLGYQGKTPTIPRVVGSHYYEKVTSEPGKVRNFLGNIRESREQQVYDYGVTEAGLREGECGQTARYASRIRSVGRMEWGTTDSVSNEVLPSGVVCIQSSAVRPKGNAEAPNGGEAGTAAASTDTPGPHFFKAFVRRRGVSHASCLSHIQSCLDKFASRKGLGKVSEEAIGMHAIEDSVGLSTVPVFFDPSHPSLQWLETADQLRDALCSHAGARMGIRISDIEKIVNLPPGGDGKTVTWLAVHSLQAQPEGLAQDLDDLKKRRRFANLYPVQAFDAHRCRQIPLWCVGWHLYRGDDMQFAYSLLAREIFISFPEYADVLLLKRSQYKGERMKQFVSVVRNRTISDDPASRHLFDLVRFMHGSGGVERACSALLERCPGFVGECLAAFNKFLWNMMASARLNATKSATSGDVVQRKRTVWEVNGFRLQTPVKVSEIVHAEYDDVYRSTYSAAEDKGKKISDKQEQVSIDDVLYPVASLFTSRKHATSERGESEGQLLPLHSFSSQLAEKLLRVFGLKTDDMDRMYQHLPLDFRSLQYRKLVEKIDDLTFEVRRTSMRPLIADEAIPDAVKPDAYVGARNMSLGLRLKDVRVPNEDAMRRWSARPDKLKELQSQSDPLLPVGDCDLCVRIVVPSESSAHSALREVANVLVFNPDEKRTPGSRKQQRPGSVPHGDEGRV
eukprot:TRINITY_DN26158_c0_g3_i1.p1 TRINITY_DN26158_c0_g3~~TRINITY_DN26158_c0_g3_i1.p1  ORF type:complete len:759 (+),score=204.63 TRINITY_DN26158_c0_g3_i1:232-2277(+)